MIKHSESHMDHGFTEAQWAFIFKKYADKKEFFIDTFELPEDLGSVTNALYGPTAGDPVIAEQDVFYAVRGTREWQSRCIELSKRPTRFVRVIAGPLERPCDPAHHWPKQCVLCEGTGVIKHACVLYTAYGVMSIDMPPAPKEVGDIMARRVALHAEIRSTPLGAPNRHALDGAYFDIDRELDASQQFWAQHALAAPELYKP